MNALHCDANSSQDPHFIARITELLTLKVRHLKTKRPHQVVVEQGGGGRGQVRGHQAGERSSFDAEDIFFFLVAILVTHCWFMGFGFHFY